MWDTKFCPSCTELLESIWYRVRAWVLFFGVLFKKFHINMDEFLLWVDIEIKLELADHRSMKTLDRTICVDLILISWVLSLDIIPNSAKMILDGIETGNIVDWGLNGAEDVTDANITGNDVLDVDWVLHFDDLGLARGTNNRIGWFTLGFFGKLEI